MFFIYVNMNIFLKRIEIIIIIIIIILARIKFIIWYSYSTLNIFAFELNAE